ncbi:CUE domain-containing protein [Termitomyces sp. J132]|nr:CUE domain-containing protein [Termitomyces sp. J132]
MSQYKSALRQQQSTDAPVLSKYRSEARILQELFPSWTNDDLQSLLVEVQGDVQTAAMRITEGTAEQWGSVSRKKDKKVPASAHPSKESFSTRGDARGARGGRGGRGGPGRGGAVRGRGGPPRGGAVNGRGTRADSNSSPQINGAGAALTASKDVPEPADASTEPVAQESTSHQNEATPSAGWADASSSQIATPSVTTSTSWGGAGTTTTWGTEAELNGSSSVASAAPSKTMSNPATSKKSWAQIARPQEKPAPVPPAPAPVAVPAPLSHPPALSQLPASEPETEPQPQKWEEPTTVQAPTWDDEPQSKPAAPNAEAWSSQIPASKSEPAPIASIATPVVSQAAVVTPSPKLTVRPAAATHRSSARYKNIDQPVVMPSSFGSGIEKVGMQFGSLSLGGESIFDSNPSEPEAPTAAPEAPSTPAAQSAAPANQELPAPPPATAPAATSVSSTAIFAQQQVQPQQPPAIQSLHTLPSSVSQPSQLPGHVAAAASPIQHHSTSSLNMQNNSHSNYFGGRGEAAATAGPYFHTPTPPAGQAQDSPYGSFGQLGAQPQHQQASHLAGFGQDYNAYGENQRGFYDTYQQGAFGNRNVLGHEDVKGLPGTQPQPPASGGIPPSNAQGAQPHGSLQAGGQPQPAGAQAPQGYSVPYPYYTYPQSQQFYSYNPPYGAVPQFKYPTMYQPPSGPASAPSPVSKQPGTGVGALPQGNPYSQGLYPQGGYDDYQPHPHHSQHTQQHSLGLNQGGVGAGEYGKQLYGSGNLGIPGFMGPGGQGASTGGPTSNAGGPRGAGSPETPYKYAAKEGVAGRGAGQQGQGQGQPQGQSHGGQVPQGQGFYGGARFGANSGIGGTGGVGGPQQSAHHPQNGPQGHPGYPQSGNDGNFYQYRGQQQGYWQ